MVRIGSVLHKAMVMQPSKVGTHLLVAGLAICGACIAVLAALFYGWNYGIGNSMVIILLLPLYLVFIPFLFWVAFMYSFLMGMPAVSVLYGWQTTKRNWRAIFGVILMITSVVSIYRLWK
jgi:hypothetical protein